MLFHDPRLGFSRTATLALALALIATGCIDEPDRADELGTTEAAITTTSVFASIAIAKGASKTGTFTAVETGTLTFETGGTGDADLYIKRGAGASTTVFDCKSESS